MDSKNVIAAISLSAAVIILYALFFSPEPQQIQEMQDNQKNELVQNSEIPKLVETKEVETISRDEAINNSERLYWVNAK